MFYKSIKNIATIALRFIGRNISNSWQTRCLRTLSSWANSWRHRFDTSFNSCCLLVTFFSFILYSPTTIIESFSDWIGGVEDNAVFSFLNSSNSLVFDLPMTRCYWGSLCLIFTQKRALITGDWLLNWPSIKSMPLFFTTAATMRAEQNYFHILVRKWVLLKVWYKLIYFVLMA